MLCLILQCKPGYRCIIIHYRLLSLGSLILNFLNQISVSFPLPCSPFFAALIGNTVIHLDKALARIREYERMKLKAEFNPCIASAAVAGDSEVSNAEHPSANTADQVEGTQSEYTTCKYLLQHCLSLYCLILQNF